MKQRKPARRLALTALVAVGLVAAGAALAHPDHPQGDACEAGFRNANIPGHPCVPVWGLPLVEWCRSAGLTPMEIPVNYLGERAFQSGFHLHDATEQLTFVFEENHWACFLERKEYSVAIIDPPAASECTGDGYEMVVMQRTNRAGFTAFQNYDYFCMPPRVGGGNQVTDFELARNGPHCMKKKPYELYRPDVHGCTKAPTTPANVSARLLQGGQISALVEVSWDPVSESDARVLADYYIIETVHRASTWTRTIRVETLTPNSAARMSHRIRIARPAEYTASNPWQYAFRVRSGVHRRHYGNSFRGVGVGYFADSAFSPEVVIDDVFDRRDTCAAQGWELEVDGRTHWCNIPWENAADGTTGERCSISQNQRPLWCGSIFGHNLKSGRKDAYELPSRDSLPYGDRFLYNCPHNVSEDFQECVCRPGFDNLPKDGGGYYCRRRLNCPAEQARENIDPYTCGVCLASHDEVAGVCRERLDCPADQFRENASPYTCGVCISGYREFRSKRGNPGGVCRPDRRITTRDIGHHCPEARRLDFYSSTSVATIAADSARVETFTGVTTFFDGTTGVATFVESVEVGRACRLDASDDWCYTLDYNRIESDAALTHFRLRPIFADGSTSQIHLPANAQSCDDKYPACGGENYGRSNPFAECACDAGFVPSNPAAPDNICTKNCAALKRDSGTDSRNCGACLENFVDDIGGGEHCRAVVDCAARNRLQRNGHQCAGCAAGFVEDDAGVCRERVACPAGQIQQNAYQCGACLPGHTMDDAGACQPILDCAAENRHQLNEYTCGACLSGLPDVGGACVAAPQPTQCAMQNRRQLDEHTCGACLSGLPDADGVCGATPLAAQCEASDGEIRNTAIELTSGECLPVQQCLRRPVPNARYRTHECFLWSDTGRAEALADAHRNDIVWADASTSGVCVDRLTRYREADVRRIRRTCADAWAPAARSVAWQCGGSASLSDPDNVFSDCVNDYTQDACEAAGGEWKRTSHALDPRGSERTDTCLIDGVGCWLNARSRFDPDATVFYDIDHPHYSPYEPAPGEPSQRYEYPGSLNGSCEDLYPNNCALATEGNAYLGCSEISHPGAPTIAPLTSGTMSLRWQPSVVSQGSSGTARISGYTVFRQARGGEWTQIGFAPEANYIDAEAPRERYVRYRVRTEHSLSTTLTSAFSEYARVAGCAADGHTEVARASHDPLCVPDAAQSLAQLCANAGWWVPYHTAEQSPPNGFVHCGIGARDAQSGRIEHCGIWGDYQIACSDPRLPFGDPPSFPTNNGVSRQYAFNCPANSAPDPDYASSNAPAQECVCDEGHFKEGEQCMACESIGRVGVPGQRGVCSTECASDAILHHGACAVAHSVAAAHVPLDGGVASVTATSVAAEGGRLRVPNGQRATFIATPAADYYVQRWSRGLCRDVGDETAPGVEKTCAFAVSADVTVTVTFALGLPRASAPKHFTAQLLPATNDGPTAVRFRWQAPYDHHTPQGAARLPLRFRWLPSPYHTIAPALRYSFQRAGRHLKSGGAACPTMVFEDDDYVDDLPSPALSATGALDADAAADGYGVCRSYRLAAQTVRGVGVYATANLFIHKRPSRPETPTATTNAHGSRISLRWREPTTNGSPILGYEILRQIDGEGDFVLIAFAPSTPTLYVDSAVQDEAYSVRYRVRARNAAGDSELSAASNAVDIPVASFLAYEVFRLADIVSARDRLLDIYFVINNNNPDMEDYQRKLGESAAAFIDYINADAWNLFITSSYFIKPRVGGFAAKLAHPDHGPTAHFMTSTATDAAQEFSDAMRELRLSSEAARSLRPRRALSPLTALLLSVDGGADYFRNHPIIFNNKAFWRRIDRRTPMAVIVVSNEPERMIDTRYGAHHLDRASPDLNRLKAGLSSVKDEFAIYPLLIDSARMLDGVGRFSPRQRQRAFAEAADKPGLRAAAAATGGAVFVAGADFSETMRQLVAHITDSLLGVEQITLSGVPYNPDINITFTDENGQQIDWTSDYSVRNNRLIFRRSVPQNLRSGLAHVFYYKTRPGR